MNKNIKKLGVILFGLVLLLAACNTTTGNKKVIVGSKDFTENLIVSEIYALALEEAGFIVERKQNIAGSLTHESLVNGEIDLYPEYTGTGLLTILKKDLITDPEAVYKTVKEDYNEVYNLTWLDYAAANDSQGLAIRTSVAKELGITTISDLQKNADKLRFASQGEFDQRSDGMPLLEKEYGVFNWMDTKVYDNGLKYEVLRNDQADVTPAYTTDGALADKEMFTVLIDDKKVWPPYNLAPVVRNEILGEYPEIATVLNDVSKKIDTDTITKLNAKVDIDKEDYETVAKEFFESIK